MTPDINFDTMINIHDNQKNSHANNLLNNAFVIILNLEENHNFYMHFLFLQAQIISQLLPTVSPHLALFTNLFDIDISVCDHH